MCGKVPGRSSLKQKRNETKQKSETVKHTKLFFKAVMPSELRINVCVGALTRLQPCSLPVCAPTRVSLF